MISEGKSELVAISMSDVVQTLMNFYRYHRAPGHQE